MSKIKKFFRLERRSKPRQPAFAPASPMLRVPLEDLRRFEALYIVGVVDGIYCRLVLEILGGFVGFRVLRSTHPGIWSGQRGFLMGSSEGSRLAEKSIRDDMPQMMFIYGLRHDEGSHFLIQKFDLVRLLKPTGWDFLRCGFINDDCTLAGRYATDTYFTISNGLQAKLTARS